MNIKEEILLRTNKGLEIFCFYMPIDFVIKRNFRNPLYDDQRASCNIYLDIKSDCYRMKTLEMMLILEIVLVCCHNDRIGC